MCSKFRFIYILKMSNVDPGGGRGDDEKDVDSELQSTPDLSTLQENFSQQQV